MMRLKKKNREKRQHEVAPPKGGVDIGRLFDEHAPFLLRVAQRLSGRGAHVEDAVQEVFLIAHRRREALAEHTDHRAWLYRTTVNVVQHHRRSIARRIRLAGALAVEELGVESPDRPDEALGRSEQAELIRQCTMKLPIKQREVFVLYELESMEGTAIAELLEIPENTVWSRLHHARKGFRVAWERKAGPRGAQGGSHGRS